uniref:Methyltransferase domain-containing protein n=1 Tax=Cyanothece sp. (strain PCC 7425 / ATCC 29141) TaxID=395961 RepID=B8HQV0_CYAP4
MVNFINEQIVNKIGTYNNGQLKNCLFKLQKGRQYLAIREIINGGQADFDTDYLCGDVLYTPEMRVLIYCYQNFEQHLATKLFILENHTELLHQYLNSQDQTLHNTLFIDIGCGPLTGGIALAHYYCENMLNPLITYVGIDKSEAMLRFAQELSRDSYFADGDRFLLFNPMPERSQDFSLMPSNYINSISASISSIVFNFSYFFASPSLSTHPEYLHNLIDFVYRVCTGFPSKPCCLLFQNPQSSSSHWINKQWYEFIRILSTSLEVTSLLGGEQDLNINYSSIIRDYRDLPNWNNREIKLRYDIIDLSCCNV